MASMKGRITYSWTNNPVAILGRVVLALRYDRQFKMRGARPQKEDIVDFFWREIPYVSDYVMRQGHPVGGKLSADSIYGRAYTPWAKSKPKENPYRNKMSKAYCDVAEDVLDAIELGRHLTLQEFKDSAKNKKLTLHPPMPVVDLSTVDSDLLISEVNRRMKKSPSVAEDEAVVPRPIQFVKDPVGESLVADWASLVLDSGWDFQGVEGFSPRAVETHLERWAEFGSVYYGILSDADQELIQDILTAHHNAYYKAQGRKTKGEVPR